MPTSRSFLLLAVLLLLGAGAGVAQAPEFDLKQSIPNPAPSPSAQFGYAVAAAGNQVLVGAPFDDTQGTNSGAAYLFDGETSALLRTFHSPKPAAGDWFGIAVAMVGKNVLVGALGDDTGARDAGAAYLFDGSTGALLRTFQKPSPGQDDWFGGAVAAIGNNVLVGAPLDDLGGADAGAAYLFDGSTGALLRTFQNPTPDKDDWFGVALAGDQFGRGIAAFGSGAVVAAPSAADGRGGTLWLLQGENPPAKIRREGTRVPGDQLGFALAASGPLLVAGAPTDDKGETDSGSVYLFRAR